MTDWQERITRETPPAIRIEHEVRYRLAVPLIATSGTWCDLGCGSGIAAAAALADAAGRPARAVLVDYEQSAVDGAAAELALDATVALQADLTQPADLDRVRAALRDGEGPRTVTCFEVVEHLATFVPLLELLAGLAEEHDVTTILSVPNDAFSGVENPHHLTAWGEGSFAELAGLLPERHVLARQVALQGSAIALEDDAGDTTHDVPVDVHAEGAVPTHFIAAFGPRAAEIRSLAAAAQVDLDAQRAWERQREADNELLQQSLAQMDDWRAYIHELEDKLGLPRSGTPERAALDAGQPQQRV
jgi:2-polyprenyl-3-methyl-5-hydroxy-6-metoxy-1,4-benzoquinol methylase